MKLLIFAALLFTSSAFAATTATLFLKGTIAPVFSISISPEASATTLPLGTSQTNLKVGTISESSNYESDYKISITSTNLGKLKKNSTNFVVYTLKYNNSDVDLTTGADFTFAGTNNAQKDLRISYLAGENLVAGDYTDTLTFTIAVN